MAKLRVREAGGAEGEPRKPARKQTPRKPRGAVARAADAILEQSTTVAVPSRFRSLVGEAVGVRLDQVSLTAPRGRSRLDRVTLEIAPGELVALLGPTGSGKSALLRVIAGLERPSSGRIWAAGMALEALGARELDAYRLQRVGILSADPELLDGLTGVENAALPLRLAGIAPAGSAARARKLLDLLGAGRAAELRPARFGALERRLVALARAVAPAPGLLLVDEPLAGLTEEDGRRLLALLGELNRSGLTVAVFTSDPELALQATRTIRLRAGRALPAAEAPRALHAPGALEQPAVAPPGELLRLAAHLPHRAPQLASLVAGAATAAALATVLSLAHPIGRGLPALAALLAVGGLASLVALSLASAASRRRPLGMLRELGGGAEEIARVLLLEAAGLGLAAGIAGVFVAYALSRAAHLPAPGAAGDAGAVVAGALLMVGAALPAAYAARLPGFLGPGG